MGGRVVHFLNVPQKRSGHGVGVISKVGERIEVYILTPFLMEFVEAIKLYT